MFFLCGLFIECYEGMNSACRTIDLATNIIVPTAVGQMMYFLSHIVTATIIVAWNVIAFVVEILLLWHIYREYPKLAIKKTDSRKKDALLRDVDKKSRAVLFYSYSLN